MNGILKKYYESIEIGKDEFNIIKLFYNLFNEQFNGRSIRLGDTDWKEFVNELRNKEEWADINNHFSNYKHINIDESTIHLAAGYIVLMKVKVIIDFEPHAAQIIFAQSTDEVVIDEIQRILFKYQIDKVKERVFSMIISSNSGLDTTDFPIPLEYKDLNILENYNDDFVVIDESIKKTLLDKNKSGLIMLHGVPGSGKTSYIKHLIACLDANFIYLPVGHLDVITDPSFLPFIINCKNSVLIVEESESITLSRSSGNRSQSIISVLNITDGLLSNLGLKIILTHNTSELSKIDPALLRKGRLSSRYEFGKLSLPKSKEKARLLGTDPHLITEPMVLGDIYNYDQTSYGNIDRKSLGFAMSA